MENPVCHIFYSCHQCHRNLWFQISDEKTPMKMLPLHCHIRIPVFIVIVIVDFWMVADPARVIGPKSEHYVFAFFGTREICLSLQKSYIHILCISNFLYRNKQLCL